MSGFGINMNENASSACYPVFCEEWIPGGTSDHCLRATLSLGFVTNDCPCGTGGETSVNEQDLTGDVFRGIGC